MNHHAMVLYINNKENETNDVAFFLKSRSKQRKMMINDNYDNIHED